MKIYFDNVDFSSRSGPNSFAMRLAKGLACRGHTLADAHDYDVALVFINKTCNLNNKKPYVQRLDGFWFKPQDVLKNSGILETYRNASAIIFQSNFDKKFTTKFFGDHKNTNVIKNAVGELDHQPSAGVTSSLTRLLQEHGKVFVCSANWHPQKRLRDNVRLFEHVKDNLEKDSCLVVLGSNPDLDAMRLSKHRNSIYFTGNLTHADCLEVYAKSSCMFHLAWLDHCPNTVVECLSVGTPVICTSAGGTQELVLGNGIILQEDFDYELCDYDNPPVVSNITDVLNLPQRLYAPIKDMNNVVCEYESVLKSVL